MEQFNWYTDHHIQAIVDAHFVQALHTYQKECSAECAAVLQGASISEVVTSLEAIRDCTTFDTSNGEVEVVLNILLQNEKIGWYKEIFSGNGVPIEEFFVLDN